MDTDTQLAALAAIELVAKQIVDPAKAEDHRAELAVIMANTEPVNVVLEVCTILAGVVFGTGFPISELIAAKRAQIVAESE